MISLLYLGMRKFKQLEPAIYPNGICVHTEKGYFYVLNNKRYRITTDRIRSSWNFPRIAEADESAMVKYRVAGNLGFRSGTIVMSWSDKKTYIIEGLHRRQITNPDDIKRLGARGKDILIVSDKELALHKDGEPL